MNLHEYQSKYLLKSFNVNVPKGELVTKMDKVVPSLELVGGKSWVVKAQIHAGARGKAGGVKLVETVKEAKNIIQNLLGSKLATNQTAGKSLPVSKVLIEEALDIVKEFYLSLLVDRSSGYYTFIFSSAGGMDIEEVARITPEKILKIKVNSVVGVMPYQIRRVGFFLGLESETVKYLSEIMQNLYSLSLQKDINFIEINPLVLVKDKKLVALDAKFIIDDNALYRQNDLLLMRDITQEDSQEAKALDYQLNYIALDGNIGCMVNGAGLAMATMDLIKLNGGEPANFLDVGGTATPKRVAEAFKLIVSSKKVKSILVNIFGGIVRCDVIAEGIIQALEEVSLAIPVIVRLEGTNVELGRKKLIESNLKIIVVDDLSQSAKRAVDSAKGNIA